MNTSAVLPVASDRAQIDALYALGIAGEKHRFIGRMAGEWNVVMHIFLSPGVILTFLGMKARKRSVLDGRQILKDLNDRSMAGVPHRKVTLLGYNAVNQRREFVTADNLDTQQLTYLSTRDVATGTITMTASYTQAVYAEMVSGDGLSCSAGKPTSHRAVIGVEMTVRDVLTN